MFSSSADELHPNITKRPAGMAQIANRAALSHAFTTASSQETTANHQRIRVFIIVKSKTRRP